MAGQRINPQRIKVHLPYTIEGAARTLGVHKNTVRGWQAKGLEAIDGKRPTMFMGDVLRAFLQARQRSRKRPCPPGTIYCFGCRAPRPPALGMVEYQPANAKGGNLKAICGACDTIMNRRTAFASLTAVLPGIAVLIAGEPGHIA